MRWNRLACVRKAGTHIHTHTEAPPSAAVTKRDLEVDAVAGTT